MIGLLADPAAMRRYASVELWYVTSALLAPIGYVMQDVVADAMTVEAVPHTDDNGAPLVDDTAPRDAYHDADAGPGRDHRRGPAGRRWSMC
jgi:hypothetical protein